MAIKARWMRYAVQSIQHFVSEFTDVALLKVILRTFFNYMAILLSDLVIYFTIKLVLNEPIQRYPLVSFGFDQFIIGVSFLTLVGFVIHTVRSIVILMKSEWGVDEKGAANAKKEQ